MTRSARPQAPPRTRRPRRLAVRIATAGWIALMTIGCLLRHPPRFLVDALVHEVGRGLDLETLQVRGTVGFDVSSFGVRLEDVSFRTSDGRASGQLAQLEVHVTPTWRGGPDATIDRVTVQSPRLAFDVAPSQDEDDEDPWRWFDALPAVEVRDGSLRLFDTDKGLEISVRNLEGSAGPRDDVRRLDLLANVAPGSREGALGARCRVSASATRHRVRLHWQAEHLDLDEATLRALPRRVRRDLEPLRATVEATSHGTLELARGGRPVIHGDVAIERAEFDLPEEIGARITTRRGTLRLRDTMLVAHVDAEVEGVPAQATAWIADVFDERTPVEIGVRTESGRTGPWIGKLLQAVDGPADEHDAFRPEGDFALALFLHRVVERGGLRARARIEAKDLSARFEGFAHAPDVAFPLPLEKVRGTLSVRRGQVLVPRVLGERGGTTMELSVGVEGIGDETLDIAIRLADARIDEELERAGRRLERFREIWETLRPEDGRLDVDLRITREPGQDDAEVRGLVQARDCALHPEIVGTRLWDVSGAARIHPNEVDFDARGRALDGSLTARTRLTFAPRAAGGGVSLWDMHLTGRSHRLDPALREVLPEPLREALADVRFGGLLDFAVEWHEGLPQRPGDQRSRATVTLHPGPLGWRDCAEATDVDVGRIVTRLEAAPAPPESTARPAFQELFGWFSGTFAQGTSLVTLGLDDRPRDVGVALSIAARRSTAAGVRERLVQLERLPAEAPTLGGHLDLDLTLRGTTEAVETLDGTVRLLGVRVALEQEIATGLEGLVHLEGRGLASCSALRGRIAGAETTLEDVRARWEDDSVRFDLLANLRGLELGTFSALFGPELRAKLASWRLEGDCDLERVRLALHIPWDPASGAPREPTIDVRGEALVMRDVSFFPGVSFREVRGRLEGFRGTLTEGRPDFTANLRGASGSFLGMQAEDIQATIEVTERHVRVVGLRGFAYRGAIESGPEPFLVIRHASARPDVEPEEFALALRFRDVQMREMLTSMREEETYDEGRMSGELALSGRPGELYALGSLRGTGRLRIEEGKFGSIPFLRMLNPFLGPKATDFHALETRFRVEGCQVRVDDLELISDMVRLGGRGALGIDGSVAGILDITYLEIIPVPYLDEALGVGLGWIFENILNKVVHIAVSGTLESPIITPGLTRPEDVDTGISPRPWVPGPLRPDLDRIPWLARPPRGKAH